jgi:CBS domain containing-hemolysin-like protein
MPAEILEITMIVLFGASWPMNVIKSIKTKSAKGKSLLFLVLILVGYIAGITSKFVNPVYMAQFAEKWYVLFFYFLNFFMVLTDTIIYFRNRSLDKKREQLNENVA